MNLTKTQQRWFYPAQEQAMEELRKRFEHLPCNYQLFSKDRIVESYTGFNTGKDVVVIDVLYVDHGSDKNHTHVSVLIFEKTYIQGWQFDGEEKKG